MKLKHLFCLAAIMLFSATACEKDNVLDSEFTARIEGFDLTCTTCIISFPNNSETISEEIGESHQDFYHASNLDRGTFRVGQKLNVKLRETFVEDSDACFNPAFGYKMLYIIHWETVE